MQRSLFDTRNEKGERREDPVVARHNFVDVGGHYRAGKGKRGGDNGNSGNKGEKRLIRLSPSTVSLFRECPRCFWRAMNQNIHRPRGIFPSLPGGMDLIIKTYFDGYRKKGDMPPEVRGKVRGRLFEDLGTLEQWRNWRLGLRYEDKESGGVLSGALDDCLVDGDPNDPGSGLYIPLDYKTRGGDLRGGEEKYYQHQLDIYTLMLQENGYKTAGIAYLLYFIPKLVTEGGTVRFDVIPHEVKTDAEMARQTLREAITCLRGTIPNSHSTCEYCSWGDTVSRGDH